MAKGCAPLKKIGADSEKVQADLERRLENLRSEGFVDCKAMSSPDRNSSTADKLWTLNNVLRKREIGEFKEVSAI